MASSSVLVKVRVAGQVQVGGPVRFRVSRQLAPVCSAVMWPSAAVTLIWKSSAPLPVSCPCGASRAARRSGPPTDWPTVSTRMTRDPAPVRASAPRREIVGRAGAVLTRYPADSGSGRVRAVLTRNSLTSPRSRITRITVGSFSPACTQKAAMKTQPP